MTESAKIILYESVMPNIMLSLNEITQSDRFEFIEKLIVSGMKRMYIKGKTDEFSESLKWTIKTKE